MNTMSLSPLFRRSIGFDRLNDLFENAVQNDVPSYPPYNVEKHGENDYRIAVAAAGFSEEELDVNVDKRVLSISAARREREQDDAIQYLHQGIAQRGFKLSFRLDENIEIQGARMENGLLIVDLLRVVPEEQRPRQIPISTGQRQMTDVSSAPVAETATA
ncbi:Hsp20 family protein [Salinicola aestuarinus]|uniref:Hsp20 family protein n=1 Tax=Salinicola aestuarinus TaxID=1949082 RepID=UPI000DA12530|nr:Hsp20 family protein [Salinicola aestuarinus]